MERRGIMPEKVIEFLKEYQELCKKYNMGLEGCGCCDSPHIWKTDVDKFMIRNINYNNELSCITIDDEYYDAYKIDEKEERYIPITLDEYLNKIKK